MFRERYKIFGYLHRLTDLLTLVLAFLLAFYLRFEALLDFRFSNLYLSLLLAALVVWTLAAYVFRYYPLKIPLEWNEQKFVLLIKTFVLFLFLYFAFIVVTKGYYFSRVFHFYFLSISFVFFLIDGLGVNLMVALATKRRKFRRNLLIIGGGKLGRMFYERVRDANLPYWVVGFLDDDPTIADLAGKRKLGRIADLEAVIHACAEKSEGNSMAGEAAIDELLISLPLEDEKQITDIVTTAEKHFIDVKIIPSFHKLFVEKNVACSIIDGIPVISFHDETISHLNSQIGKRVFDLLVSGLFLLLIYPFFFLVIAMRIMRESPGPVFFKQVRKGYRGRPFVCNKFRTMRVIPQEIADRLQATPDDPRKTRFGDSLRRKNLDELPQFWNVFKGEMSLVGPRPHPLYLDEKYQEIVSGYNIRYFSKPGLTGWAQVNGFRGETRDVQMMQKRVTHDIWYIENWTFWLDLQILLMTVWRMLKGDPQAY